MGPTPATLLEATLSGRTSTGRPPGEVRPAVRRPTILMPTWTTTAAEGLFRVQATDAACIEAIAATGGEVVLVPLRTPCAGEDALDLVLQRVLSCDGLFFPGSAADVHPSYYAQRPHPRTSPPHALLDWWVMVMTLVARGAGIPVLGVCGGAQRMSVALGGTLQQDLPGHRAEPVSADHYVPTLLHLDLQALACCLGGNCARGLLPPGCLLRLELREPACTIKRSLRCRQVRSSGRMQAAWWRVLAFPGSTRGRGSRWDPCSTSKHGPRIVWPSASCRPSSRRHVPLPPVGTLVPPGDLSACVNGSQLSHCCPVLCQGRCLLRPCPAIPLGFVPM